MLVRMETCTAPARLALSARGNGHIARHSLLKFGALRKEPVETPARHDLLLIRGNLFQLQAGQATQFPDRPGDL